MDETIKKIVDAVVGDGVHSRATYHLASSMFQKGSAVPRSAYYVGVVDGAVSALRWADTPDLLISAEGIVTMAWPEGQYVARINRAVLEGAVRTMNERQMRIRELERRLLDEEAISALQVEHIRGLESQIKHLNGEEVEA